MNNREIESVCKVLGIVGTVAMAAAWLFAPLFRLSSARLRILDIDDGALPGILSPILLLGIMLACSIIIIASFISEMKTLSLILAAIMMCFVAYPCYLLITTGHSFVLSSLDIGCFIYLIGAVLTLIASLLAVFQG